MVPNSFEYESARRMSGNDLTDPAGSCFIREPGTCHPIGPHSVPVIRVAAHHIVVPRQVTGAHPGGRDCNETDGLTSDDGARARS